eukprot:Seg811.12 transcript_id=Seg811.12/GoldUCD/mRNA.D3Y31 product="Resact receptor" protein_id=Seg811.12/GoldUCD/D3Y31
MFIVKNIFVLLSILSCLSSGGHLSRRSRSHNSFWQIKAHQLVTREKRSVKDERYHPVVAKGKDVFLGLLIPYNVTGGADLSGYSGGEYYASAFLLAIEDINNSKQLLPNVTLHYVWNDTMCLVDLAIRSQIWQHCSFKGTQRTGVDAFIGTGCKCTTVVRNAAALNLPLLSHVSKIPSVRYQIYTAVVPGWKI